MNEDEFRSSVSRNTAAWAPLPAKTKATEEKFVKADTEKNPLHLLPMGALESVGHVLAFGAKKYAPGRWRLIDNRSRYFSAMLRHLFAWWRGQDIDPESGLSHLSHAACCALFLLECEIDGLGKDDRPSKLDG